MQTRMPVSTEEFVSLLLACVSNYRVIKIKGSLTKTSLQMWKLTGYLLKSMRNLP